jgi:RNA-binding protein YhbY
VKWREVQSIYPNQFVKFEILHSEEMDNQEVIDEVAVIGPIKDEDATRELLDSKGKTLIYHTSKNQIVVTIRKSIGLRRKL